MNEKILSILIPYHNEDENLFRPLLSSLNNQIDIDFNDIEIIISNNIETHLMKDLTPLFMEYKNIYPHIKYVECPYKSSMGPNRQNACDQATGQYGMYCDFDDVLYSPTSLKIVLSHLSEDYDVIDFVALKELDPHEKTYKENGSRFEINGYNIVLLHGKVFNLHFLKNNNITFCHNLYAWEDMYYNQMIELRQPRRIFYDIPIYIWKYRASSVSKREGEEWDYQCKYWVDSTAKYYYLIEYAAYYDLFPGEKFYEFLAHSFAGWYLYDFDYDLNPVEVPILQGAIMKCFDPKLNFLNYIQQIDGSTKHQGDFPTYCRNLIKDINVEEVFQKYKIGHFNDIVKKGETR